MRVLIDHCLSPRLRHDLREEDEGYSARYMGWAGLDNGDLMKAAHEAAFDVFITKDRGVEYEQNLTGLNLAVIILRHPVQKRIRELMPDVRSLLGEGVKPGSVYIVEP